MGSFVMAAAHLTMAIGAFGYKNSSLYKLRMEASK